MRLTTATAAPRAAATTTTVTTAAAEATAPAATSAATVEAHYDCLVCWEAGYRYVFVCTRRTGCEMVRRPFVETQWVRMRCLVEVVKKLEAGRKISWASEKKKAGPAWLWPGLAGWGGLGRFDWPDSGPCKAVRSAILVQQDLCAALLLCLAAEPDAQTRPSIPRCGLRPKFQPQKPIKRNPQSPNRENRIWPQNFEEQPSFPNFQLGRFRPYVDKQSRWLVTPANTIHLRPLRHRFFRGTSATRIAAVGGGR